MNLLFSAPSHPIPLTVLFLASSVTVISSDICGAQQSPADQLLYAQARPYLPTSTNRPKNSSQKYPNCRAFILRTDLLAPRPDLGLSTETTEVTSTTILTISSFE